MGKEVLFLFDKACITAFEQMRTALVSAPILQYYHKELKTMVKTNASDGVIAEILSQQTAINKPWHPVDYFSKTISPAELNY